MAPRHKITRVGGNLHLVAQFRVLCCPGLLTAQHYFLFLFLFPLFLSFLLLFSSFLFFSFSPFLLSFPPFLFSFPPFLFLFPSSSSSFSLLPYELNWSSPFIAFKGAMHVDTWLAMCHTCMPLPCIVTHGLSCVTHMACRVSLHMACHVSPDTRYLEIREILIISKFNEIRLGS